MARIPRRLFALFGAIVLLAAMLPVVPAQAWEDPPALQVTVQPAKNIYMPLSAIEYVVTVTNISGGMVNNISAAAVLGEDLDVNYATAQRASLIPNQSFSFSYTARLRTLKGLDVLLYPLLWLRNLLFPAPPDDPVVPEDGIRGCFQADANARLLSLSGGSYDISTSVLVYHDSPVPYDGSDPYAKEKEAIIDSNMTDDEKRQALNLLSYKMDENGIFYVAHERWGKGYGFNQIYDLSNPLIQLVYSTVRVKFHYDNKDWMICLWKGRYGLVMLGGEIGIYNKPAGQAEERYYAASDEEELVMAMEIYQHRFGTGQTKYLFTRGPQSDWWLTGFVPGSFYEYNKKSEIIMVANIQFPDEEMLQAFEAALAAAGFAQGSAGRDNPETYAVSGNGLKLCWQYIDQGA